MVQGYQAHLFISTTIWLK